MDSGEDLKHTGAQTWKESVTRWERFKARQIARLVILEGCGYVFALRLQRLRSMKRV